MSEDSYMLKKSNKDRTIAFLLGLLFLSFYILTAQGSIQSLDGTIMYELTKSIVEKKSVAIDNPAGVRGKDGRFYSKYGLGQSLAAIPFYLAGKYLTIFLRPPFAEEYVKKFFVSMLNSVVTALTCVLLYVFAIALGYTRGIAILITFVFSFGTMAWPYAQTFYSEPLASFLILGTFYLLMRDSAKPLDNFFSKEFMLAGFLFALAVLTRIGSVAVFPVAFVYLALTSKSSGRIAKRLLVFLLPLLGILALILFYNYYCFGSPWHTGYESEVFNTPLQVGIYGFLLSPGRGFFWYNPILIFALLGLPIFYSIQKQKTLVFLVFVILHFLLYSRWGAWEGGWVWGPRFLLVIVPYLVIFLGAWAGKLKSTNVIAIFSIFLLLSIAVQFSAVFVSPERYYYEEYIKDPKNYMHKIQYDVRYSPLWRQWRSLSIIWKNISKRNFLHELAQEQISKGVSEEVKGKRYFLTHNLAFNSPNLWLFYLWYAGVSRSLIIFVAIFLLSIIMLCTWKILLLVKTKPPDVVVRL